MNLVAEIYSLACLPDNVLETWVASGILTLTSESAYAIEMFALFPARRNRFIVEFECSFA